MTSKKKPTPEKKSAAPKSPPLPGSVRWGLAAIVVLAAFLRCVRLDSPVGGFHAFNEAHYALIAENFATHSLLAPTPDGAYVFLETPPLYPYLLHGVFRIAGFSVLAGRLVSVASSLALLLATFFLGRRLFGEAAGLCAALLLAVAPVAVLTGRNIQTDSTMLAFLVLALLFAWRAETGPTADRLGSGLFAGLALFTKLFAAVGLLGLLLWEIVTKKGLRWLRDSARWKAAALALALPAGFYGYHAVRDFGYLRRDVTGGAAVATHLPATRAEWAALAIEAIWAFSPGIALALAAGLGAALWRPSRQTLFVLFPLLAFAAFYLVVHKHSYYVLTLLPFGALLAGQLFSRIPWPWLARSGLGVIAASAVVLSLLDLASMKLGFSEFADFGARAAALTGDTHLLAMGRDLSDNDGSVVQLSDPRGRILALDQIPVSPDGKLEVPPGDLFVLSFVSPQAQAPPGGWLFSRERLGLELFGWTLAEAHPNPHFFRPGAYSARRTGGAFAFGFFSLDSAPALMMVALPADAALYKTGSGFVMRRLAP